MAIKFENMIEALDLALEYRASKTGNFPRPMRAFVDVERLKRFCDAFEGIPVTDRQKVAVIAKIIDDAEKLVVDYA